MSIIVTVSSMIIPAIMLFIVGYGMIKKKNVYDDFVNGAKDGFTTVIKVMPTLIGLMVAVGVLRESGFMTDLGNALGKFTDPIGAVNAGNNSKNIFILSGNRNGS